MTELLRSNDTVLLSFVEALLRDAGVEFVIADGNMSVLEGSIGAFPRRVLVLDEHLAQSRRVLVDAGLGDWIKEP